MTLNYTLNDTDSMAFQAYYSENHPFVIKLYLYFLPIALIAVSLVPAAFDIKLKYPVIISCILIAIIWVIFFKKLYPKLLFLVRPLRIKIIKLLLQKKHIIKINNSIQLTFTDYEIICTTNKGEVKMSWSLIENYSETNEHYFIFFINRKNLAFVIPKRCLINEEEEALKQILNDKVIKRNN